jgi:wyosine [tRNA(Phe)-imidazoG37] synthetase (radical SAM superfamily)
MTIRIQGEQPRFDSEARYRIVVQGTVPESWTDRLAGMEILPSKKSDAQQRSILQGALRDQAELNGVLETLYRLHLTIVNVKQLDADHSQ